MFIKKIIQCLIGVCKCKLNNIGYKKNVYIGLTNKIVNNGKLIISENVIIRPGTGLYVNKGSSLSIGPNTEIGRGSTIASHSEIIIGEGVLTEPYVFIADYNHEYVDPNKHIYLQGESIEENTLLSIGEGTWIGTNVVIVGNVKIGKQCVIGANSVVTKNIPDYCVAVGAPAKVIKRYSAEKGEWIRVIE
jgi:acetyltransferase-like isoleucine patch superfamily enzyme